MVLSCRERLTESGSGRSRRRRSFGRSFSEKAPPPLRKASVPRASWLPIILYCLLSIATIFYDDCYPLWLLTPRDEGGLAMSVDEIGVVMSVTAVITLVYQLALFPFVSERCPPHTLFWACSLLAAVLMPAAVVIACLPAAGGGGLTPAAWVALVAHNAVLKCANNNNYTALFCCINNSCPAADRGAVNGLAMSIASAFKAAGPTLGASLFAYALSRLSGFGVLLVFAGVAAALAATAALGAARMGRDYDTPVDDR